MSKIPPFRIPLPSEHLCPGIMKSYRAAREEWVNSDSACTDWPLGLCGLRDQSDEENRYCKLPLCHDGDHFYVDRGSYDAAQVDTVVATGSGECHVPPANIYDVLSRLFEAANRLELPWVTPSVLYPVPVIANGIDFGKEPYAVLDSAPNRRLDVAIVADGVVITYLIVKHSGHFGDGGVSDRTLVSLTTPANYARAYRWLVTGEQ